MDDEKSLLSNHENPSDEELINEYEKYIASPEGQQNVSKWERDLARVESSDIDIENLRNELEADKNQPELASLINRYKDQNEEKELDWDRDNNWHAARAMLSQDQLNEHAKFIYKKCR